MLTYIWRRDFWNFRYCPVCVVKADAPTSHIHTVPLKVRMRVRTAEAFSRTLDLQSGRTEFDEGFERFPVRVPAWPDHHKPTL
jgi:hypothetical protein